MEKIDMEGKMACLEMELEGLQAENHKLSLMLGDAEEQIRSMKQDLIRLSAIKDTVEVIFGRKFNG